MLHAPTKLLMEGFPITFPELAPRSICFRFLGVSLFSTNQAEHTSGFCRGPP